MQKLVNGKLVDLTQKEIDQKNAEEANWEAEKLATQYQEDRRGAYPSIVDQLDALWKGGAAADAMKKIIDDIKLKYPKE